MSGLESRALDGCVEVAYADGEHMRFLLQSCGFLLLTFMVASCERHRSIGCPHDATLKTYKQWKESTRFPYIAPRARQEQIANNIEKVGVGSTKKDFVEVLGEPDYEEEMYPKEPDRPCIGYEIYLLLRKTRRYGEREARQKSGGLLFSQRKGHLDC